MADEIVGDWPEHRRMIIAEQRRMNGELKEVDEKFDEFRREVLVALAELKVRTTIMSASWGALGGALITFAGLALWFAARW